MHWGKPPIIELVSQISVCWKITTKGHLTALLERREGEEEERRGGEERGEEKRRERERGEERRGEESQRVRVSERE